MEAGGDRDGDTEAEKDIYLTRTCCLHGKNKKQCQGLATETEKGWTGGGERETNNSGSTGVQNFSEH